MKYILVLTFSTMALLFSFCKDDNGEPTVPNHQDSIEVITDTVRFYPHIVKCIMTYDEDEYVINDDSTYQLLLEHVISIWPECENYTLPEIDFDERTLLGKYSFLKTINKKPIYNYTLTRDNVLKKYYYGIDIKHYGEGVDGYVNCNWLSIPKISEGYTVEFSMTYTIIE